MRTAIIIAISIVAGCCADRLMLMQEAQIAAAKRAGVEVEARLRVLQEQEEFERRVIQWLLQRDRKPDRPIAAEQPDRV